MINSLAECSGLHSEYDYLLRSEDFNGKPSWNDGTGVIRYGQPMTTASNSEPPAGLQHTVRWIPSDEIVGGEVVYYDSDGIYGLWFNCAVNNWMVTWASAVNELAGDMFVSLNDILVSGISEYSPQVFTFSNMYLGRPRYTCPGNGLMWWDSDSFDQGAWIIIGPFGAYYAYSNEQIPCVIGWVDVWDDELPVLTNHTDRLEMVALGDWSGVITRFAPFGGYPQWEALLGNNLVDSVSSTADWPPFYFDGSVRVRLGQVLYFDSNGGTGVSALPLLYGDYGTLPTPVYPGSIFLGWFTEPLGHGTRIFPNDSLTTPDDDNYLYAYWSSYQSGPVSCGDSMLSNVVVGIGTDIFSERISSRFKSGADISPTNPIPAGGGDEA